MTSVEARWPELAIVRVGYGHPDALRLIEAVQAEYVARYGGPDESPMDPLMFEPPHGSFFVGYVDGEPVATGAWRASSVEVFDVRASAEVKRMYVVPTVQRRGYARTMLAHLEADAFEHGRRALVLETGTAQPEAIALYLSSGYSAIGGFGHYRDSPVSRSFAKVLG